MIRKPTKRTTFTILLILPLLLFTIFYTLTQTLAAVSNQNMTYPNQSFDQITKNADLIAMVEIQSKLSETSKKPYLSLFQAKLIEVYKCSIQTGMSIKLYQDGSTSTTINDIPLFQPKENLIVFLKKDKDSANTFHIVSGAAINCDRLPAFARLGLDSLKKESMMQKSKNVVLSPLSLYTALTVAMNGAEGQTLQQMKKVMGINNASMDVLNRTMSMITNYANTNITDGKPGVTKICNSLWINNTLQINDSYLKTVKKYYNSDTYGVDFSSAQTIKDMNQWITDKTSGLLKNVVKSLDKDTSLGILNALYFKGSWSSPFEKAMTKKEFFQLSTGNKLKVDMMNHESTIGYYEDKQVKAGVIDYYNGSMMILLPKNDINEYTASLKATDIVHYNKYMKQLRAKIKLPKFNVETENLLIPTLKSLGMTLPFDQSKADFSGILANKRQQWISQLQQNCAVKVDENGTRAAAVSVLTIKLTCAQTAANKEFYVTKPFLFVIQGKGNLMLFIGKIENPTK